MKLLTALAPTISIIVLGQLITRWRVSSISSDLLNEGVFKKLFFYLSDPWILFTYVSVLISSFLYILVLEKYPVSVAYPFNIACSILLVNIGGVFLLNESFSFKKFIAIIFITFGATLLATMDKN